MLCKKKIELNITHVLVETLMGFLETQSLEVFNLVLDMNNVLNRIKKCCDKKVEVLIL